MTSMTHSAALCGRDVKCKVFAVASSKTLEGWLLQSRVDLGDQKVNIVFVFGLKASAMTRVASRCSMPLSDTPFTSRITWPTRNCPEICTEPPFWETEREREKQSSRLKLSIREIIYQKCERKDKWEMGRKWLLAFSDMTLHIEGS